MGKALTRAEFSVFFHRHYDKLLRAAFLGLMVLVVLNSLDRSINRDEREAVHTAWKIMHGEKIYEDFFQHHHPLFYYALVPVLAVSGESASTVIATRLLALAMLVAIFFVTYRLATDIFGRPTGEIALLFLVTTLVFMQRAIEIRPDVPQTLFGLGSIYFLFRHLQCKSRTWLCCSALTLAFSFLFLQKTLFLIFLTAGLSLYNTWNEQISRRDLLFYWAVLFAALAPYYIYLVGTGSFSSYFFHNWLFNSGWLSTAKVIRHPYNVSKNTMLWSFYILGMLFYLKDNRQRQVAVLAIGLVLSVFAVRRHNNQSFMMAMPLIAMVSANAVHRIFEDKRILTVAVLLTIAHPVLYLRDPAETNVAQLQRIDYALSITAPEDSVYDENIYGNLFRRDIAFFWFCPGAGAISHYREMSGEQVDIYRLLAREKPRLICDPDGRRMTPSLRADYVVSPRYPDIFIRMEGKK